MEDKPLIEVHEIRDDPQMAISDAVAADIRHEIKKLTPTEFHPGQGKAPYRQLLPGIMQLPADWLIAWGRKYSLWPVTFRPPCRRPELASPPRAPPPPATPASSRAWTRSYPWTSTCPAARRGRRR